jgi:hypothetical protein
LDVLVVAICKRFACKIGEKIAAVWHKQFFNGLWMSSAACYYFTLSIGAIGSVAVGYVVVIVQADLLFLLFFFFFSALATTLHYCPTIGIIFTEEEQAIGQCRTKNNDYDLFSLLLVLRMLTLIEHDVSLITSKS